MTREFWLSFVVLGSMVGMACDSSQPKEPQPESGLSNTAPYTAGEIKALLLEGASEEQIEALLDDFVTAAEYERAMLAMARCMTEQGIVFQEEPHWDEETHSRIRFLYIAGATREAATASAVIYEACRKEHSTAVESYWGSQTSADESTLQRARAALAVCLNRSGFDVPANASAQDFADLATEEAFWPCAKEIEIEYQLPGFAG